MRSVGWKFLVLIVLQLATYLIVILDVPIARQIIMFTYLTFVPGIVILSIFRLRGLSVAETLLFSVGLSIAFLMFTGLLMNELYPLLGISEPLSPLPLISTINVVLLLLYIIDLVLNKDFSSARTKYFSNLISLLKDTPTITKTKFFLFH